MVKEIIRDEEFLKIKSIPATKDDIPVADDLADTLVANTEHCVGMAANMIGVSKRIIVFYDGDVLTEMFNPVILKREGKYETEEGCLSLVGKRKTTRYKKIKVEWEDRLFRKRIKTFTDFSAEIIQHEIDHFDGIII